MNRMRIAASSRDAALRAQQRKLQEALIAPESAAEEHAAELAQTPRDASASVPDPLAAVTPSVIGTEAYAVEFWND
jgi:DNA-directed RNA polymerase subunit beta'